MNHYDDLQRFKDKTRNQQYDFKDLSAQNTSQEKGSWALINQLSPVSEENKLAMGGHVSLPQPQPVTPALFTSQSNQPVAAHPETVAEPHAEVTPTSATSILRDVAQQLSSAQGAVAAPTQTTAAVTPAPDTPEASTPDLAAPVPPEPARATPVQPAPAQVAYARPAPASYARLFAPKPAESKPATEKNQPLHTLLERIASCR
ncbi:cellulose biosynthesis protein BcsO [Yokenella regensburgei]|uniref:cellulose biosynthesis protein BcsO n=1 Tax=Yokenella regensburgei TaxID=158877 RepID=UPI003F14B089